MANPNQIPHEKLILPNEDTLEFVQTIMTEKGDFIALLDFANGKY